MSAPGTYSATLPDGRVVTRKSDRTYTHVLALYDATTSRWCAVGFAGSEALALKTLRAKVSRWGERVTESRIIPVTYKAPRVRLCPVCQDGACETKSERCGK